jgi:hypothetical protein
MNRALALAVLPIAALTPTSAQAASPRRCGTVAGFQLVVHRGSVHCSGARHLVQAFRSAERKSADINGWRCESATGGGGCIRGGSSTSSAHGWIEWFFVPRVEQKLAREEEELQHRDRAKAAALCEEEVKDGALGQEAELTGANAWEWECFSRSEPNEVEWITQEEAESH